jgi:hypothetical protein
MTRQRHLHLTGHGFEFDLGTLGDFELDFLKIRGITKPRVAWDDWATQGISRLDFNMAWVADSEYEHWQNAYDPLQYTAVGKSYAQLPTVSKGLPYPLEREIIDTTSNPRRRLLRRGCIESVGSVMWLGESFWQITGADKRHVADAHWLRVFNLAPSVVKLQAAERSFTTAEGASGELQSKLRLLLFLLPAATDKNKP